MRGRKFKILLVLTTIFCSSLNLVANDAVLELYKQEMTKISEIYMTTDYVSYNMNYASYEDSRDTPSGSLGALFYRYKSQMYFNIDGDERIAGDDFSLQIDNEGKHVINLPVGEQDMLSQITNLQNDTSMYQNIRRIREIKMSDKSKKGFLISYNSGSFASVKLVYFRENYQLSSIKLTLSSEASDNWNYQKNPFEYDSNAKSAFLPYILVRFNDYSTNAFDIAKFKKSNYLVEVGDSLSLTSKYKDYTFINMVNEENND